MSGQNQRLTSNINGLDVTEEQIKAVFLDCANRVESGALQLPYKIPEEWLVDARTRGIRMARGLETPERSEMWLTKYVKSGNVPRSQVADVMDTLMKVRRRAHDAEVAYLNDRWAELERVIGACITAGRELPEIVKAADEAVARDMLPHTWAKECVVRLVRDAVVKFKRFARYRR